MNASLNSISIVKSSSLAMVVVSSGVVVVVAALKRRGLKDNLIKMENICAKKMETARTMRIRNLGSATVEQCGCVNKW